MFAHRSVRGLLLLSLVTALVGCANPSLVSIQITPTTETFIGVGGRAQFTAIGTYQQGNHLPTTVDITNQVTWKSNAVGVATINSSGVTTAVGLGSTEISASKEGYTGLIIGYASAVVCLPDSANPGKCAP
jgi:hypothetical protein